MGPLAEVSREWAWGGGTGEGMRVAVVDSGIEPDHPAVGGSLAGAVHVEMDPEGTGEAVVAEDEPARDLCGHGTACAGIIHSLAPQAEMYSVRVLGRDLKGKAVQFAAGLRWAIENGMHVINLSLSTSRGQYFALFHDLADKAYFKNIPLRTKIRILSPSTTIRRRRWSSGRPASICASPGATKDTAPPRETASPRPTSPAL
jgi:hypothetical protein